MRAQYASRDHRLVRIFTDDGAARVVPADDIEVQELLTGIYVGADCLRAPIEIEPEDTDRDMLLNEPRRRGQAPAVKLSDETSAAPEAHVTTQAEEVKPTEGDIHEAEYDLHEQPSEPAPLSIDDLISSGTMLTEDEYAMRVGILSGKIEQHAQQRIAARYDANARADMLRDLQNYINKGALGLETTPAEDDAYARANAQNTWITAQETHARQLRESLPTLPLTMLRVYDLKKAGWPDDL